ncbi:hypothetical protein [Tenacibaculum sp.]|uniref:hypothetical protein n=1 Tax=Tenacibaculum sp. TaxID=1906242 RepID=UPI003D0CB948
MGYLGVDIHENVVVKNAGFDENNYFGIDFTTKVNTDNLFEAFDEGESVEADEGTIKLFSFNILDWEKKPKTAASIGTDINELKNTLVDILKTQMPEADAKAKLSAAIMFKGLGVTAGDKTLNQKLLNQQFLDAVFNNIVTAFTAAIAPFYGQNPFRIKFVRQSKAKHYPKFPKRGKGFDVLVESMQVPKEASKVKWTDYELKNGLNSGVKQEADAPSTEDTTKVENMFGDGSMDSGAPVDTAEQDTAPEVNPFAPQQ